MNYVIDIENQLSIVMALLLQLDEPDAGYTVNAHCSHKVIKSCYTDPDEATYWALRLYQAGAAGKIEIVDPDGCITHKYERILQPALVA